jgi:hypothetical protein
MPSSFLASLGIVVLLYLPTLVLDSVGVGGHPHFRVFYRGVINRLHRVALRFNISLHNPDITEGWRLDMLC